MKMMKEANLICLTLNPHQMRIKSSWFLMKLKSFIRNHYRKREECRKIMIDISRTIILWILKIQKINWDTWSTLNVSNIIQILLFSKIGAALDSQESENQRYLSSLPIRSILIVGQLHVKSHWSMPVIGTCSARKSNWYR